MTRLVLMLVLLVNIGMTTTLGVLIYQQVAERRQCETRWHLPCEWRMIPQKKE